MNTNFIISNNMDSAWHQFNANPAFQNSYVTRFASMIQQTAPITPRPVKRGPFSMGASNNAATSVGVPEQTQVAASSVSGGLTTNFSAKGKAATVAKSVDQGISFFQAAQFVESRYKEQSHQFYDAVTSIGIDSPGELGNFLNAFGGYGIGFDPEAEDAVRDFMFAAQHLAEKAPGTMASYIQGTRQMAFQPRETLANFTSRAVETAEDFGADTANAFNGLFSRAPRRELMNTFFSTSDAVREHGKEMTDKFIFNLSRGALQTEGDIKEIGAYLEYTRALANTGDTEQLNTFLNMPVSDALHTPLFNTGGGSMAVAGVDTRFPANAKEFGVTHSEKTGLGVVSTNSGGNTAGLSLSGNDFGSGEAVSVVYQTFQVTEGNTAKGTLPANITVNLNHDVRSSTWNPTDLTATLTSPITTGATIQGRVASPVQLTASALMEGAGEAAQNIGIDAAAHIVTDTLHNAHRNPDGNLSINAFLVEKNTRGDSRIAAKQEVVALNRETDLLGLPQSDNGLAVNTDITFPNITLTPENDYTVVLTVSGAPGTTNSDYTNLSGHAQINEIKIDFNDSMGTAGAGAYQNKPVAAHGTYSDQDVTEALARRRSMEAEPMETTIFYEPTIYILQNRLMEVSPPPDRVIPFTEDSENTLQDMLVERLSPAALLNNYDFPGTDNLGNHFKAVW